MDQLLIPHLKNSGVITRRQKLVKYANSVSRTQDDRTTDARFSLFFPLCLQFERKAIELLPHNLSLHFPFEFIKKVVHQHAKIAGVARLQNTTACSYIVFMAIFMSYHT